LKVSQAECCLQMLNQNVVEIDSDSPHEKEARHQYEGNNIPAFCKRRG